MSTTDAGKMIINLLRRRWLVVVLVALPLVLMVILMRSRTLFSSDLVGTWKYKTGQKPVAPYSSMSIVYTFDSSGHYTCIHRDVMSSGYSNVIITSSDYRVEGNTIHFFNVQALENGKPYCFQNGGFCDYDDPKQPFSMRVDWVFFNRIIGMLRMSGVPDSQVVLSKVT